jgi:hypothetical protein
LIFNRRCADLFNCSTDSQSVKYRYNTIGEIRGIGATEFPDFSRVDDQLIAWDVHDFSGQKEHLEGDMIVCDSSSWLRRSTSFWIEKRRFAEGWGRGEEGTNNRTGLAFDAPRR